MSNLELTTDDLVEIRESCRERLKESNNQRDRLLEGGSIERSKFNEWRIHNEEIENQLANLSVAIFLSQLRKLKTDKAEAKNFILKATSKLEDAHKNLMETAKFLEFLADLVELFTVIVDAINTRSLAKVGDILARIDNIFNAG